MKLTAAKILSVCLICVSHIAMANASVDIPYESFTLDNGLKVLVHEDRKAPVVAVNIWYHVGSKDEKPGKTGFAHLFEHLMFNGTENYDNEYFLPFEQAGATDQNGTTWLDRTNYFQNVPTTALDMALWMESDRMGHLLGAITQEKLDEQRGVVQNEKRQGENRPYGRAFTEIQKHSFPKGHPYRWTTIGSMEDLNAASLEDVKTWFKTWYGPSNAVLTLAGDIDLETAKEKAQLYFGDIPGGKPVSHTKRWIAKRTETTRKEQYDRVPQARIYRVWNVPPFGDKALHELELAAAVLGQGKNSALYKRLVYQDQLATSVSASVIDFEIASIFYITADVKEGISPAVVESIIDEELNTFLKKGPSKKDLSRVQTSITAGFIRGVEKVGGFSGKAQILGKNATYMNDPSAYKQQMVNYQSADSKTVKATAQKWLSSGDFVLNVLPFPKVKTAKTGADRSKVPAVDSTPDLVFPTLQRAELSNGLKIVLAERQTVPIVEFNMLFDAGYAADQGKTLGTANFTMSMMDEGTKKRSALEIAAEQERLGAEISTGSSLDSSSVSLSALKQNLSPSLALYADIIQNPTFSQEEMDRLRGRWIAGIKREKTQPRGMGMRVLPPLLYGKDHAYGIPLSGTGTEDSIAKLAVDELKAFHNTWIRPENATLMISGDTTMAEIKPLLESVFAKWRNPEQALPVKSLHDVAEPDMSVVYLLDKPGAVQSVILAGHLAVPMKAENTLAFETMNDVFGGKFSARLNMNLREDKSWAYGAYSFAYGAKAQRPWMSWAPVQSDKTTEAMQEIVKEMQAIASEKPPTADEIAKIRNNEVRSLPGKYETNGAVLSAMTQIVKYGYADDHVITYKKRLENLSDDDVVAEAKSFMRPNHLTWVVVGDLEAIEQNIRDANLGEVKIIDANGSVIR